MGIARGTNAAASAGRRFAPAPRLLALIATLAASAAAAAMLAGEARGRTVQPSWPAVVLLGTGLVVAGRLNLDFRHHGEVDSLDLFEAALTPAVFFLPAPTAVLLAAGGKALSQLLMRMPPVKAAFNVAQWAAATGTAALVFAALRPAGAVSLEELPALATGMASAAVVNLVALGALFRLLGAARPAGPSLLRSGYLARTSAITAVNIATGMLAVVAVRTAPVSLGLFLGPLLLIYWAGRGYTLEYTDSQRMAALQRATHALAAFADPRDGIPGYLAEVVRCFDARAAEVVLIGPGGSVEVRRLWAASSAPAGPAGVSSRDEGPTHEDSAGYRTWTAPIGSSGLYETLLSAPLPSRLRGHRGGRDAEVLGAAGWRDCIAVPLTVAGEPAGLLCVYDRSGSADFESSDLMILETLGREMTAALQRARLLDDVLEERSKLARIVNGTTDGIAALGPDGIVLTWNPAFAALTGYGEAVISGGIGLDRLDPRDVNGRTVSFAQWATGTEALPNDIRIRHASGSLRWLSCSYAEASDSERPALLILLARDVTELRRHQWLLAGEARVLELIAGNASLEASLAAVALMIHPEEGLTSSAIFLPTGAAPLRLVAEVGLAAHLVPVLLDGLESVTGQRWADSARTGEPVVLRLGGRPPPPDGAAVEPELSCCWAMPIGPGEDGDPAGIVTAAFRTERDPTDTDRALLRAAARLAAIAVNRHEARIELTHQASHDSLTGLPNRSLFLTHCTKALQRAERGEAFVVVMFIDLDRFKFVNDSLGHDAGDQILVAVADRLRSVVRPGDTVARFGGDEFTILCESIADPEQARLVAERVQHIFGTSFTVRGREVFESASIGIAVGRGRHLADELVENADAAMYRAKDRGGNRYEFFDAAMRHSAQLRLGTYVALRNAVDRHEFTVLYQPMMSLREGRLVGVEALIRWQHPTDGSLPPSAFIGLAEETGLIVPIGERVLRESLRQLRRWQPDGSTARRLRMNVNLSARQLTQPDLVSMIEDTLDDTATDPQELCIEITESVLVLETTPVQAAVGRLKALGVGLSIDDFGTGHSSLTNLRRLPVDQLKVDRSFVAGMSEGKEDAAIVSAVIHLGHDLGLTVVAEGIETVDQVRRLRALRCDEAQGYYFAAPLEADRVMAAVHDSLFPRQHRPPPSDDPTLAPVE